MKKFKFTGSAVGILAAAILANAVFPGFAGVLDGSAANTSKAQLSENYIDNSDLVPVYAEDADV